MHFSAGIRLHSLQSKIFMFILMFLIIPFCLTFLWLDKPLENRIEKQIGSSMGDTLSMVKLSMNDILEDMFNSITAISLDPLITSVVTDPEAYTAYEKIRATDSTFRSLYATYLYKTENYITLLDHRGNIHASWYAGIDAYHNIVKEQWYKDIVNSDDRFTWIYHERNYTFADRRPLITVAKVLRDPQTNASAGVAMVSIVQQDLYKLMDHLEGTAILFNEYGTMITSTDTPNASWEGVYAYLLKKQQNGLAEPVTNEIGGEKYFFNSISLMNGWHVVQIVPYETVFKDIYQIRKANLIIAGIIFLVFMLVSIYISYRITRPLKLLTKKMNEMENNDFNQTIFSEGQDEVASLIKTYNSMVRRIRHLLERLKSEYKQKEELRFRALQSQIKPHFILNTLNNIKWMAYIKKEKEVAEMLSNLGAIVEASIGMDEDLISLKQELSYIHNYVTLQKIKYNEKVMLKVDIADEWLESEVIKFILQPIVENSIYHGIEPLDRDGVIVIKAFVTGNNLVLQVSDNGIGMSSERLSALQASLESKSAETDKQHRVGLRNIHERLKLQYGQAYGIQLCSTEGKGTVVEIVQPLIWKGAGVE